MNFTNLLETRLGGSTLYIYHWFNWQRVKSYWSGMCYHPVHSYSSTASDNSKWQALHDKNEDCQHWCELRCIECKVPNLKVISYPKTFIFWRKKSFPAWKIYSPVLEKMSLRKILHSSSRSTNKIWLMVLYWQEFRETCSEGF